MSNTIRFTPEAEHELNDATAWYDDRNPELGDGFTTAVEHALSTVQSWPRRGSPVEDTDHDLDIRRVPTGRFPYQVIYLNHDDSILVLAIAHHHRQPNYWTHRATQRHRDT